MRKGRLTDRPFRLSGIKRLIPSHGGLMVIFFSVVLKELLEKGRDYPWPRPDNCPRCGACRIWGHGYVDCFFDGFHHAFLIKRYRCPDCRCVIRCRPSGYFKRFQAPIETIRKSISSKEERCRWLKGVSCCRQAHWWRALKRRIEAFFGHGFGGTRMEGFDLLLGLGRNPVCRAI